MHGLVEETLCGVGECDEMTIDSIHAIAALCVGIVLIALSWLLPRDSGEYVRCTQCLKYRQACNSICPACLTPDSPTSSAPQYAYILATRTRGMHIQLLLAVGEFLICVAQCALPCLIIKNIVDNAGLPTAYGIDQNSKSRLFFCSFQLSPAGMRSSVPGYEGNKAIRPHARWYSAVERRPSSRNCFPVSHLRLHNLPYYGS